jgi:PAS domain-containing protein
MKGRGMKKNKSILEDAGELRRRAEERFGARHADAIADKTNTPAETQRLLHELQVHQIELEMQNEELQRARTEVEEGLSRYTDLYEFAPVGYLTLNQRGEIQQVNLTGSRLLGLERSHLVGKRLSIMVDADSRPVFNAFLAKVFENWGQGKPARWSYALSWRRPLPSNSPPRRQPAARNAASSPRTSPPASAPRH